MKKMVLAVLIFSLMALCGDVFARNDDTGQLVQAGFGLLSGVVNSVSKNAANKNAGKQTASQATNAKVPAAMANDNVQSQDLEVVKEDAELKAFWQKEQPILDQKIRQGKTLKIKDLYLGMNLDNAYKILKDNLGEGVNGVQEMPPTIIWVTYYGNIPIVIADEKKRVTKIVLPKTVVDTLFKTSSLPAEEFAKKFVESYHIPNMEPCNEQIGNAEVIGWRYLSPEGYRIIISVDKNIFLDQMAKPSEMKFD
jgi:hypothetical protein